MDSGSETTLGDAALSPAGFGAWLRSLREAKGLLLREAAARADMDPSHLGKAEKGTKPPTQPQTVALAKAFAVDPAEMAKRYLAMHLYRVCGGDPQLVHSVGGFAQEEAAPYLAGSASKNRRPKK